VVSDYYAIEQMAEIHRIAPDIPGAAELAMDAGVDVDLPSGIAYSNLGELVAAGKVSQAQIDKAVERVLTMKFNAGLFEQPFVTDPAPALASNTPKASRSPARRRPSRWCCSRTTASCRWRCPRRARPSRPSR
jgi:beta-glucosidase